MTSSLDFLKALRGALSEERLELDPLPPTGDGFGGIVFFWVYNHQIIIIRILLYKFLQYYNDIPNCSYMLLFLIGCYYLFEGAFITVSIKQCAERK